eukprot:TRINITY_DN77563_c0_g1_i1.p1 TRINITY_DN77563_c0_g1~~TRINITY_DN77563_c0_g1_i1.p1  ORF type:complete len:588 (+),score=155.03 TRINITY_DN77563_c0_g1_i1:49-1764(+)
MSSPPWVEALLASTANDEPSQQTSTSLDQLAQQRLLLQQQLLNSQLLQQQLLQQQLLPDLLAQQTVLCDLTSMLGANSAAASSLPMLPAVWPCFVPGVSMASGCSPLSPCMQLLTPVLPSNGIVTSDFLASMQHLQTAGESTGSNAPTSCDGGIDSAEAGLHAKRCGKRTKGRKIDWEASPGNRTITMPVAVGELTTTSAFAMGALAKIRRQGAKSQISLKELLPHVVELSRDSEAAHFLEGKLDLATAAERIAACENVLPEICSLAGDAAGSGVVQKLLEVSNPGQRKAIIDGLKGEVMTLSLNIHGCRVIQKALQVCPAESLTELIEELKTGSLDCIWNMHGNHVIQRFIEHMPPSFVVAVIEAVEGHGQEVASHVFGCRIIQRLLEHCEIERLDKLLGQILSNVTKLAVDPFGNYVVRHILEHGSLLHKQVIICEFACKVPEIGLNKHGSNVLEKCFQASTKGSHAAFLKKERRSLIQAVLGEGDQSTELLVQLMGDRYGKYVLNSLVEHSCSQEEFDMLQRRITQLSLKRHVQSQKQLLAKIACKLQQHQLQKQQFVQHQLQHLQLQ